jgi:competence protein ComEC
LLSRPIKAGIVKPSLVLVAAAISMGLFGGYLLGGARVADLDRSPLTQQLDERVNARVTVTGAVKRSGTWQSATATVQIAALAPGDDRPDAVLLPAAAGEDVLLELDSTSVQGFELVQGQILTLGGVVSEPQGESASGFDQKKYLRNQGISVVLTADAASLDVVGARGGVSGWFDRLRVSARAHLSRGPDERLDELLQGIVMGDTVGLDAEWVEAFRRAGTSHILSVSGLHVASLAAIMLGLARLARAPRWVGFVSAAVASALMIPFVGASPPVVRSVVMIVIVLFGQWVGRQRDQWQILGLAAAAVLSLNPYSLRDPGFQLSFAAFAGMIALLGPVQRALRFLPSSVASNGAVSVAASVGTAPVSLVVFGRTSLVAVFANLVVVPVLAPVTGLGLASVVAGFVWPGLSTVLDYAVSPALAWTVQASRLFAAAPVLETYQLWRSGAAVFTALLAVPVALALAGRILPARLGRWLPFYRRVSRCLYIRRPRKRRRAAGLAAAVLVVALLSGWAAYPSLQHGIMGVAAATGGWPDSLEIRVLDVGQGNAILLRTPDHHALLFDCGPSGCDLEHKLRSLGVGEVDLVVISHPHADHFAGLLDCVDAIKIDALLDRTELVAPSTAAAPADASASGGAEARSYLELRADLERRGCEHILAHDGMSLSLGGLAVRIYAPDRSLQLVDGSSPWALRSGPPGGDELNAGSVVALASWGESDVLLPGDAEADTLELYDLPAAEVLVVSHHGSRGAVSPALLERLGLQAAIISVGEDNSFGHPDPATMSLLQGSVGVVLRTDLSGWVSFVVHDGQMSVTTERRAGS